MSGTGRSRREGAPRPRALGPRRWYLRAHPFPSPHVLTTPRESPGGHPCPRHTGAHALQSRVPLPLWLPESERCVRQQVTRLLRASLLSPVQGVTGRKPVHTYLLSLTLLVSSRRSATPGWGRAVRTGPRNAGGMLVVGWEMSDGGSPGTVTRVRASGNVCRQTRSYQGSICGLVSSSQSAQLVGFCRTSGPRGNWAAATRWPACLLISRKWLVTREPGSSGILCWDSLPNPSKVAGGPDGACRCPSIQ